MKKHDANIIYIRIKTPGTRADNMRNRFIAFFVITCLFFGCKKSETIAPNTPTDVSNRVSTAGPTNWRPNRWMQILPDDLSMAKFLFQAHMNQVLYTA